MERTQSILGFLLGLILRLFDFDLLLPFSGQIQIAHGRQINLGKGLVPVIRKGITQLLPVAAVNRKYPGVAFLHQIIRIALGGLVSQIQHDLLSVVQQRRTGGRRLIQPIDGKILRILFHQIVRHQGRKYPGQILYLGLIQLNRNVGGILPYRLRLWLLVFLFLILRTFCVLPFSGLVRIRGLFLRFLHSPDFLFKGQLFFLTVLQCDFRYFILVHTGDFNGGLRLLFRGVILHRLPAQVNIYAAQDCQHNNQKNQTALPLHRCLLLSHTTNPAINTMAGITTSARAP